MLTASIDIGNDAHNCLYVADTANLAIGLEQAMKVILEVPSIHTTHHTHTHIFTPLSQEPEDLSPSFIAPSRSETKQRRRNDSKRYKG